MTNNKTLMLAVALLAALPLAAQVSSLDKINDYGVYVVADKGYIKFGPYNHMDNFVDFKYLNEVPWVKRAGEQLKIIVYAKDFSADNFVFELRPIDTVVDIRPVRANVKPLAEKDMYELSFDQPVPDGTMVHVHSGSFFRENMGVVMLGDTQSQLVKYFGRKDLPGAQGVHAYLDDALHAYPDNAELKKQMEYWSKKALQEKDITDYGYVEEQWEKYSSSEKIHLKLHYLEDMVGEINSYLDQHPDGAKAREAKERKGFAETRIKEYRKML